MYITTPLVRSAYFPHDVLLKLENTQPSGSFKSRGMTRLILQAASANPASHVFSSSGGNAGLAAAEAAKASNLLCTVVVPRSTKSRMIERIKRLGAKVIVYGSMWLEADMHLRELMQAYKAERKQAIYCHPFHNPILWEGHSTIIDEIFFQIQDYDTRVPSAIVLSCGGGGLYMGVMKGLERMGWADKVPVIVVETEGAPTFHKSLEARKPVQLTEIKTVATSLGSTYVPQDVLDYALQYKSRSMLVTDKEALDATAQFASDHCAIVEPACGATLSPLYAGKLASYAEKGPVVAIVCGGTSWPSATGIKL